MHRSIPSGAFIVLVVAGCSSNSSAPNGAAGSDGGGASAPAPGSDPSASTYPGTCSGVEAPATHPVTEQTVCSRTVPSDVEAPISCTPLVPGSASYDGCSGANTPCGAVTGCVLERDQPITGQVAGTYAPGPAGFVPPTPPGAKPIPGMGVTLNGTTSGWFARGDGTPAQGSCSYPPERNIMAVAISSTQFGTSDDPTVMNSAYWCGACAEVVGRSGRRVRVVVVDQCTGCTADHLDTPAGTDSPFEMMDDPDFNATCPPNGEQPVAWKLVPCETCGGVTVTYVEGFNSGTPALLVTNHRLPLVKLEEMTQGAWVEVRRQSQNWYYPPRADGEDTQPLVIRFTAIDGATITATFPVFVPGQTYEAMAQF